MKDSVAAHIAQDRPVLEHFRCTIEQADEGSCVIVARVCAELVNAAGYAHGGLAYAMMDTACAYALRSLDLRGVTTNGNIHYVRGCALDDHLSAKVEVVSRSRRLATLRGEVWLLDENGAPAEIAAHGTYSFALRVESKNQAN